MRQVTLPPENYARGYKAPVKSIELCEGLQNYATGYKIMRWITLQLQWKQNYAMG